MAIDINPNRIKPSPGRAGATRTGANRTGDGQEREFERSPVIVPNRAEVNYIPAAESLSTLIRSAITALRQGVTWDRGTILNLVV